MKFVAIAILALALVSNVSAQDIEGGFFNYIASSRNMNSYSTEQQTDPDSPTYISDTFSQEDMLAQLVVGMPVKCHSSNPDCGIVEGTTITVIGVGGSPHVLAISQNPSKDGLPRRLVFEPLPSALTDASGCANGVDDQFKTGENAIMSDTYQDSEHYNAACGDLTFGGQA